MRVLHVVTGLNVGGAEMQLCGLCESLQQIGYQQKVISLLPEGPLSPQIRAIGIECQHLGLRQDSLNLRGLGALRKEITRYQPDLIHSWMYHACLYSSAASLLSGSTPHLWSIHYSSLGFKGTSLSTLSAITACRLFSFRSQVFIAYCAQAAKDAHESKGYCEDRSVFIPNGYDASKFFSIPEARQVVRSQLDIPEDAAAFGLVARFHPIKDHATFLEAAGLALRQRPGKLVFILIGDGMNESNTELRQLIEKHRVRSAVILAGARKDMPSVYAALDFLTLSSRGEAFPNVICEAMLCERPCISTDVGDCRAIIGDTGFVVPVAAPSEMGKAMLQAVDLTSAERERLGVAARQRIVAKYSKERYLESHINLYNRLIK